MPTLLGDIASLESFRAKGLPILLIFTKPNCDACNKLLPSIASWHSQLTKVLTVVLISEGTADHNREKFAPYGLDRILLQKRREVATDFHVEFTPGALIVGAAGDICSPVYSGSEAIATLVRQATASKTIPPPQEIALAVKPGDLAPIPHLRDLAGNLIDLSLTRTDTLILFWSPRCSFCAKMLPELKEWEIQREKRMGLIIIASGTEQANRDLGLRSPIVLDQASVLMQSLRVPGTPSAFLVAAGGKVVSTLKIGSDAIWSLAGRVQ